MHADCEDAVAQFLGRDLKASESRDVDDLVSLHMRLKAREDRQAWLALTPQERLEAGAKAAADGILADLRLKQRRVSLQIAAHDRIESTLNDAFERLPADAKPGAHLNTVSQLLAFDPAGRGMASAETWAHSIANEAIGELLPLWNSVKGLGHLFENREGVRDLVHELRGEDTGNAAAKAGARLWRERMDRLRERGNAAGMDIGKLEDWYHPQSWSQSRVAAAGVEKFTADMPALLARDRYLNPDGSRMDDEQLETMLRSSFDSIITDGQNKVQPGRAGVGIGSVANRHSAHRALFFKDADAYLTAQGLYGESTLWPSLTGHIRSLARDIGLAETLGPNAEQTFRYFNDRTLLDELRMNPQADAAIRKQSSLNEALFDYVAGKRAAVDQRVADAGQAFRNFETAAKLGKVVITALGDEAGMAATAFANRVPWSESLMRELTYLNPANTEDRAVAAHAGLGINGMIGGLNRFGKEDFELRSGVGMAAGAKEFTSKLATSVLQASGAEAMWDIRRKALGSVLMSYLGKWTRQVEKVADLNFEDHGVLTRKGVTEQDWQTWKLAQLEDWGMKHGVLTPKSIWAIPDEQLASLGDPTALKRHASTMLLGHVLEETGMGVMDTGARERARTLLGTQSGTASGELTRSVLLFKNFAFSMMMKHWARAASMPTGSDKAQYAATLLVTGTVMGAIANQLRNLVSGKDPANMAEPRFWAEAAMRGGGLGFYGDFLYAETTSHDTQLVPALGGPAVSSAQEIWDLTGGAAFKAGRGERTDEAAKLIRFAKGNIPLLNMWYTQAAFDHLIWNNMQEAVSPGYLDRMQARAYADRGTSWWWQPQEATPQRGPNLEAAWQPQRGREQIERIAQKTGLD